MTSNPTIMRFGVLKHGLLTGRPYSSAIAAVLAAQSARAGGGSATLVIRVASAMMAVTMCGFILNDIHDLAKDRAGGVNRPIAAGHLTQVAAIWCAVVAAVVGVTFASFTLESALLMAATLLALLAYGPVARHAPLTKGLYTAGLCCIPLAYGSIVAHAHVPAFAFAALVVGVIGRELYLDCADIAVDSLAGLRTVPVVVGVTAAKAGASTTMVVGALLCVAAAQPGWGRSVASTSAVAILVILVHRRLDIRQQIGWSRWSMLLASIALTSTVHA
jgi:4-hydroxybenzoate polyprenyltransferase